MDNLDYIDAYFTGSHTDEQKKVFEQKIVQDSAFAEEVAFYISANGLIKDGIEQEKKLRFKEIYQQQKMAPVVKMPVRNIWRYMAAACVAAVIVLSLWLVYGQKINTQQMAATYIDKNFTTVGVTMGDKKDSLQNGLGLLNNGKLSAALAQFEAMVKHDSTDDAANKYAGIVCLRLKDYDKALAYFTALENTPSLASNFGKFYKAVTLLQRNKEGDKAAAKALLQQVVAQDLEGKGDAVAWLKKLD